MSRGIKHDVDRMIEQLASLHVPFKTKDGDDYVVQCHLQPVQLWSYAFPEEQLENILRTIKPSTSLTNIKDKNHIGYNFAPPKREWSFALLRKALGLKSIPEWNPQGLRYPVWRENIQIVGLGIKEDYKNEHGNECL